MALFVDTHSHIYDEAFAEDREAALARCVAAGVTRLVLPGINAAAHGPMCE
ncbi:MAG: TatD family hydrolase [Bacteroidales bacterium]|nr:TatD family hydrolase [Bacteroidales bacterium]